MEHWKAIQLAEQYVRLERGEHALHALRHASPESAATWLWRANALHALQRYEEAAESARRGLAIDAENSYLHYVIARAELMLSHYAEAEAAIVESLRLHPDEPEAIATHALILHALGKRDAGDRVMRRAAELAPDLRSVRVANAILTTPLMDADTADDLTRELLREEPEGAQEHWLRAIALLKRYRFQKAAGHFSIAAAIEPDNEMFVRAARVARHWILLPLRVTAPLSYWIAYLSLFPLFFNSLWKPFGYALAFVLYVYVAKLMLIAHPFARRPR